MFLHLLGLLLSDQFTAGMTTNQISTTAIQPMHSSNYKELNLNNRMSEIEAKSRQQENEISLLKTHIELKIRRLSTSC